MSHRLKLALAVAAALVSSPGPAQDHGAAAAGPAATVQPDDDDYAQDAASVTDVHLLRRQGQASVRIFGTAGGDPAMNGLNCYLSFYVSPQDGWRVFRIGDFLTYHILSESRGRVLLEVRESDMNDRGEIGEHVRRLLVSWTPGPGDEAPASIGVATVR